MDENKRIVEINGIKLEVDLRTAKRVDEFKIGDPVKILIEEYSSHISYPGIIAGFDEFKERPTIIVAYLKNNYSSYELKLAYINKDNSDTEICPMTDAELQIDKADALDGFDREIAKKMQEVNDLQSKKNYFLSNFGKYFSALPSSSR